VFGWLAIKYNVDYELSIDVERVARRRRKIHVGAKLAAIDKTATRRAASSSNRQKTLLTIVLFASGDTLDIDREERDAGLERNDHLRRRSDEAKCVKPLTTDARRELQRHALQKTTNWVPERHVAATECRMAWRRWRRR
jgi:hypothetical protein